MGIEFLLPRGQWKLEPPPPGDSWELGSSASRANGIERLYFWKKEVRLFGPPHAPSSPLPPPCPPGTSFWSTCLEVSCSTTWWRRGGWPPRRPGSSSARSCRHWTSATATPSGEGAAWGEAGTSTTQKAGPWERIAEWLEARVLQPAFPKLGRKSHVIGNSLAVRWDSMPPLQGAQVRSLVRELRSCQLRCVAKNRKKQKSFLQHELHPSERTIH